MNGNLFVTADTEGADGVSGLAYANVLVSSPSWTTAESKEG